MMKILWNIIERADRKAAAKFGIACLILGLLSGLAGFLIWLIIRPWFLSTADWMLCFIGYPPILSFLIVFLYACQHSFHNGSYPQ